MALKAHFTSPSCYRYLQSLDCLCLLHVKTPQQLHSKIGLESDFTTLFDSRFLFKRTKFNIAYG